MYVRPMDLQRFEQACLTDAELQLAARHWTGGLRFEIGDTSTGFHAVDGALSAGAPEPGAGVIVISGPVHAWAPLFDAVPAPFAQMAVLAGRGRQLDRDGNDPLLWWQYLPAVERATELLRAPGGPRASRFEPPRRDAHWDSPVGRYVHLELDGVDHRIYFEESGHGIPVLLQHTAGANSLQWRHLFEMPEITDHFRLIAYDLPFHGKSIPPVDKRWWEEQYTLTGAFLRRVPVALAQTLELDRPVFMGCSVGGLLALDLALHHPDRFRAVVAVEGALHIGGDWDALGPMWHPQVADGSKARLMESLCAPTSPEPYVKEVSQVYSAGWPQAFLGDLYYYIADYDLRDRAGEIDTSTVAVHIMNGEYDYSGTVGRGRAAHEAIAGSTHTEMAGIGHFPMQENPLLFARYLLPVLDRIRASSPSVLRGPGGR